MRKINNQLIISDFDGTLVNADGTVTEENKRAIAQYVADGGHFAISTGRLHYGILSQAKELGLKGAVSCCQGAVILDIETEEPLLCGALSNTQTVEICEKMEELDLHIHLYCFDTYYANKDDMALKAYENAVRKKAVVTDIPLSKYAKEHNLCAHKLLAMVDPKEVPFVIEKLEQANFEGCVVTKSSAFLVEVLNRKYSKGTAVGFLANYYGVPVEKTVGIGDQWNDLPMIERAGVGVAVKNADEKLKASAVVVDYTNEESAVAKVIQQYGYTEE